MNIHRGAGDVIAPIRLDILYQDADCVVINKPAGIFVHRTALGADRVVILQLLRDQLGQHVYPVHRLDRATSGALLFGLSSATARHLSQELAAGNFTKSYLAVVRGYAPATGRIALALAKQPGSADQAALTEFHRQATAELAAAVGPYPTARYSLVQAQPLTGRTHQLRRHFNHISHPILGDSSHGDLRHNHFFRDHLQVDRLLLHAASLAFARCSDSARVLVTAPLDALWRRALTQLANAPTTTGCWLADAAAALLNESHFADQHR